MTQFVFVDCIYVILNYPSRQLRIQIFLNIKKEENSGQDHNFLYVNMCVGSVVILKIRENEKKEKWGDHPKKIQMGK